MAKKIESKVDPLAWLADAIQPEEKLQEGEFTANDAADIMEQRMGYRVAMRTVRQKMQDMVAKGELLCRLARNGGRVKKIYRRNPDFKG